MKKRCGTCEWGKLGCWQFKGKRYGAKCHFLISIPFHNRNYICEDWKERKTESYKELESLYYELIFAVCSAFKGESRHQTALRYIREAEHGNNAIGKIVVGSNIKSPANSLGDED